MVIPVAPDAPAWVHDTATAVLYLHIGSGVAGVAAGAVALAARKGEPIHRVAGTVFVAAMVAATGMGAVIAPLVSQAGQSAGGLFACYLALTGWLTVRRPEGTVGQAEVAAVLVALAVAAVLGVKTWIGMHGPRGAIGGVPYQLTLALAVAAALAAGFDLKVIRQGGIAGSQRLARHRWRICAVILFALGFTPLMAVLYGLVRLGMGRRPRPTPAPA
jgi:uncharacterized membrane protein